MLYEVLKATEWAAGEYGNPSCPVCWGVEPGKRQSASEREEGHTKTCDLDNCLKQIERQRLNLPAVREDTPIVSGDERGFYDKFLVIREDGSRNYADARYFVMDRVNDLYAAPAMRAYAAQCKGNQRALADDLVKAADDLERCQTCEGSGRLLDGAKCPCQG